MNNKAVNIQILGGGDAFGSGGSFQTCFYISNDEYHFLVDCGATALLSMKKYFVAPELIDTILLTHLHGDHFSGIPFFLLDAQYVQKRKHPLNIVGPQGTEEKVFTALELFYPGINPEDFSYYIKFKEYPSNDTIQSGPLTISTYPVIHSREAYPHGFRIEFSDKILGFSGDTSWDDVLYKIADDADFFLCECNFYDTENNNHLNYKTIQKNLANFNFKKMVLNHLGEEMLSNLSNVKHEIAEDGKTFTV